ncbi:WAT1-related protein At5g47470-like isoform X1 [Phoenix dactylifera]|uniref:WAT1-related protein n=1 Tax=Phoenix dactylifera TaxID=42345 RepID=A0A8B8J7B0_PHODC|nr:WAT1-related protein At5g47470-like isoform X1 [Phoenix dactylifera]
MACKVESHFHGSICAARPWRASRHHHVNLSIKQTSIFNVSLVFFPEKDKGQAPPNSLDVILFQQSKTPMGFYPGCCGIGCVVGWHRCHEKHHRHLTLRVTMYQAILLLGIKKTSPAIASAMPNLAPGFIFIIAACFRFEKFDIRCKYSGIKILGTLVCLSGAIVMSFLQSPSTSPMLTSNKLSLLGEHMNMAINKEWMLGCFYLLAAVIILSCNTVLQAATMLSFPAPLSLCVITSMMGSILTAMLQFIVEGRIDTGSPTISVASIIALVLGGGVVIGGCVSFQTWCVNRKGPVLVAIFSPIQTVCSAILSAVLFRQTISLGSLAGIVLMFSGLYLVLWAKNNEGFSLVDAGEDSTQPTDDIEKPLLS